MNTALFAHLMATLCASGKPSAPLKLSVKPLLARIQIALFFVMVQACASSALADKCEESRSKARTAGVHYPGYMSGHTVTGQGRLKFYAAPDKNCVLNGVFILPSESVNAYMDYNGFTLVSYLNPRTGNFSDGWVESARLKANGKGISPRQ